MMKNSGALDCLGGRPFGIEAGDAVILDARGCRSSKPAGRLKSGDRMLKEMGSSATELVNFAYAYVLEFGQLPKEESPKTVTE